MENKIPTTITGIFYILERVTGIEPVSLDWQPSVITGDTRIFSPLLYH